jgi:alcohol dehydrogenase
MIIGLTAVFVAFQGPLRSVLKQLLSSFRPSRFHLEKRTFQTINQLTEGLIARGSQQDARIGNSRTMHKTKGHLSMKALVYQGPGRKALEDRAKPEIAAPTDAIVKVTKTTICGTDLHILKGDVPTCQPSRILGHEGVGIVDTVGPAVTAFKRGDRVLISCISACGKCEYCRKLMYSHCTTGGWILGNKIDGTQAEFVRIPYADTSLYPIPDGADEEALVMLSDILPTGFECGVLNGKVQPGSAVAIVGSGPIGLAALLTAQFYSPAEIIMIDLDDNRLETARRFGATAVINSTDGKAVETIMKKTGKRGVDTAIEAVGIPATFELCEKIVAPGGIIANIGVHGTKVDLHLENLWDRNITITTRLVDTVSTPMLLNSLRSHKIDPKLLITHRFKLDHILDAYETFGHAAGTHALKVIIEA